MRRLSAYEGRPWCWGGGHRGGGTCYDNRACTLHQWSVIPAAMAGVLGLPRRPTPRGARRRLACGVQQWETVPIRYIPCCSVSVQRASARPRRVSDAKRSRHVALSRSMQAVLITPAPCERRLSVSTRAGVPSTMRRSRSMPRRGAERLMTCAMPRWRQGRLSARAPAKLHEPPGRRSTGHPYRTTADGGAHRHVPAQAGAGSGACPAAH